MLWQGCSRRSWDLTRLGQRLLVLAVVAGATAILIISIVNAYEKRVPHRDCAIPAVANSLDRLLSDRSAVEHGRRAFLVPNVVHFYRAGVEAERLAPADVLCLLAAYHHQKPDKILVHTDNPWAVTDCLTSNPYLSHLVGVVEVLEYPTPFHVFGLSFGDDNDEQHISDLVRLRILRKHGGIFLDNRVYLTKSVDYLRKEELAVALAEDSGVDNSLILAHRDSRILHAWVKSYTSFSPGEFARHHLSPRVKALVTGAHRPLARLLPVVTRVLNIEEVFNASLQTRHAVHLSAEDINLDGDLLHRIFPSDYTSHS